MAARIRQQQLLKLVQCRSASALSLQLQGLKFLRNPLQGQALGQSRRGFSTSHILRQDQRPPPPPEAPPPSQPAEPAASPPGTPAPPRPRRRRRLLLAATFLLIGTVAGSSLRLVLSPPEPPVPGTEEDAYTISVLHKQASALPIVTQLSADPSWTSWDAYSSLTPSHASTHACAGALAGSRSLGGYQRVFQHRHTGEAVVVIYFGPGTSGWPGVVHGGCVATVLDETCGRAASSMLAAGTGVTARLALSYVRPTLANGFYIARARTRADEELDKAERGKGAYKAYVDGTIEDAATGAVCAVAEALFIGPKGKRVERGAEGMAVEDDGLGDNVVPLNHRF